jgi:hypothetical protein
MRLCKFHFSIASPSIKPPINKKMIGLAYGAAVSSKLEILSKGKRINGNNATTGIGKASVTHQVIINPAMANTLAAAGGTANGLTKYSSSEIAIPASSEIYLSCCLDKQRNLNENTTYFGLPLTNGFPFT